MADQEHFLSTGAPSPHYIEGGLNNGGCLTGHLTKYTENDSCSYRWQAVARSRSNRKPIYNLKKITSKDMQRVKDERTSKAKVADGSLVTSAYYSLDKKTGKMSVINPPGYATRLKVPDDPKDWWVETGTNFEGFIVPYWNNAHHMIPKGTFNEVIDNVEKKASGRVRDLIVRSLIEARYNINHHKNMILLPQDKEVGILFRLPRHLILEDDTAIVEEGSTKFNHQKYNKTVIKRLQPIIDNYKAACDKALKKDCKKKFIKLSKTQLETLSRDLYAEITAETRGGKTQLPGGTALSELPAARRFKREQVKGMPY